MNNPYSIEIFFYSGDPLGVKLISKKGSTPKF